MFTGKWKEAKEDTVELKEAFTTQTFRDYLLMLMSMNPNFDDNGYQILPNRKNFQLMLFEK